jgi:hypothetical protein
MDLGLRNVESRILMELWSTGVLEKETIWD